MIVIAAPPLHPTESRRSQACVPLLLPALTSTPAGYAQQRCDSRKPARPLRCRPSLPANGRATGVRSARIQQ